MAVAQPASSTSISALTHTICSSQELGELRQQAHWLSHMLDVMPTGMIVLDVHGRVKMVNQVAIDLLGEPLQGQLWRDVIARAFRPQADDGHEISLHNGRKVKLSLSSLHPEPGQLIVLTDLTETRQLQSRVGHMQRLSSLGRMVASLAHQIRTPLSAAMLYAENLLNNTLDPQHTQRFAGKLTARLSDLEQQVNDMLLFAKSGDGVVCKSLDAKDVVLQAMATCQAASADKQYQLHLQCDNNAEFIIKANSTALQGALQNLITNAIHASDDGATVTVAIEPVDNTVQLKVIDTGTGISADRLASIRQPFVTSKTHGTGLGLAVVDAVMKSHHGELLVQSIEGQGSCFTLVLPADIRVTDTVEQ